jgi:sporulation protein YlmC with PRC-barrel domain
MKTSTLLVATLLGLAIATTQGQTQSSTTTSYVQTSKIVGMKVKDSSGQEVGVVKDVVLDRNTGCMAYTVLSTGGTGTRVTGGAKIVAVPWTVYTTTSDPSVMTVRVERDRVYNAPAFDYARIDEYSTSGYINNVYSYYGVAPGVGVGVGASGTTTTGTVGSQTGVAGQVGAAASPGMTASPAATAMASPTATVATSPAASPRATASPTATAKATATSTASRRATAAPSSEPESTGERRSHRHGESSATASPATSSADETTTERATGKRRETTSEEGTSETGSSKKSKRSKTETSEESSPAEPSATP